jgi:nucleotide-binding universal stress UspA family protein
MESIQRQLRELVPDTHGEHCLVDFKVVYGKPVEEILRVGQATRANLIVMGAKKRTSLAGRLRSSGWPWRVPILMTPP